MSNRIRIASRFLPILPLACCLAWAGMFAEHWSYSRALAQQDSAPDAKSTTVVDLTVEELRQIYSAELADLEFSEKQDELASLLRKVGERVEVFFRDFPNTASKEHVRMERVGYDGRVQASAQRDYSYLLLVRPDNAGIQLEEDRTDSRGRPLDPRKIKGFFVTSGYASLCIYLHPSHQHGARFRYLGRQTAEPSSLVIAFAQRPEVGDFLASYGDKDAKDATPLLMQGIVWMDPRTFQILRMRTDLLTFPTRSGLTRQSTQIWFSAVHFNAIADPLWLPRKVIVEMRCDGLTFRDQHLYSDYKLFTVESQDKVEQPQIRNQPN